MSRSFFSMIRPQVSHFLTTHGTTYDTTTPRDAARGRKGAQPTMDDWEGGTVSNKNTNVYCSSHSMKCLCIHAYNYIHALKLFHACSTANATTQTVHEHVTCKVQYMICFYLQLVGRILPVSQCHFILNRSASLGKPQSKKQSSWTSAKQLWTTLHPEKLTWNLKMEVRKIMFLFNCVMFRFHVNFQEGINQTCSEENAIKHPSHMWIRRVFPVPLGTKTCDIDSHTLSYVWYRIITL